MTEVQARSAQKTSLVVAMVTAALIIVQQIGAKTVRDTFFLSHYPASDLPKVMIAAALASLIAAVTFSQILRRFGPTRALPGTYTLHAGLFFLEWWFIDRLPGLISVFLYIHMGALGPVVISGFWSLVNEQFDPHTAKQFVSRIAASAAFGGVLGGIASERVIHNFPLSSMLPLLGGITLLGALLCRKVGHAAPVSTRPEPAAHVVESLGSKRYLRDLATIVLITSTTAGLLDYVLKSEAAHTLKNPEELGSFFALFHAALSVLVFLVQSTLSAKALQKLGIAGTMAVLPAAVLLGGILGGVFTRLWTVALVNGLENTLRNSLFRSGYELLYTPVDKSRKRAVKTMIDVAFDRLGDIAAAGLALLTLALVPGQANQLAVALAAASAALGLMLSLRLHQGYVDELASSLRSGTVNVKDVHGLDATTQRTLSDTTLAMDREQMLAEIRALQAKRTQSAASVEQDSSKHVSDLAQRRTLDQVRTLLLGDEAALRKFLQAETENEQFETRLLPFVIPLLAQRQLARPAISLLQEHSMNREGFLVDALLDREQPDTVRRRVPRVLQALATRRSRDGLVAALDEPDFGVRYYAAQALFRLVSTHPELAPARDHVFSLVSREANVSTIEFDRAMSTDEIDGLSMPPAGRGRPAARLEYVFMLLSTVLEAEPLELCLKAIASGDPSLRGTALEYLENVLPTAVHGALARHVLVGPPRPKDRRERQPAQIVQDLHLSISNLKLDIDTLDKARSTRKS